MFLPHVFCKFKELYSKKTLLQRGKESGVIKGHKLDIKKPLEFFWCVWRVTYR
jgi:hypothetical protein